MEYILDYNCAMVTKRNFAVSVNTNDTKITYKLEFTTDQQKYLLETLNQADTEQLVRYKSDVDKKTIFQFDVCRYNVPKNRIKSFYDWRKRNGQFNSLTDVLYVEGLGVKTLNKVCRRIIEIENGEDDRDKHKPTKLRGHILSPTMSTQQNKGLQTALGIRLYTNGVCWARINRDRNTLNDWDLYEFNTNSKKLTPIDALQLVIKVCSKIPPSDVYIFETPASVTPAAQQSPISVAAYVQRTQFLSMLITLLSTSTKHNPSYSYLHDLEEPSNKNDSEFDIESKVFFLKPRLSARLFRTLIGSEHVSAATTVVKILANGESDNNVHTSLVVNTDLHNMYNKQLPVNKEVLGQALLLIMTFMDVCIYQNPNSLKIISSYCR